jgi:multiple RNA-binding domain-containing protein 1
MKLTQITETKLRNHLISKGNVTDLKLQYWPDGTFRHFAYVGYKTPEEAETARDYFNNTFLGAVKIKVETWFPKGMYDLRVSEGSFRT